MTKFCSSAEKEISFAFEKRFQSRVPNTAKEIERSYGRKLLRIINFGDRLSCLESLTSFFAFVDAIKNYFSLDIFHGQSSLNVASGRRRFLLDTDENRLIFYNGSSKFVSTFKVRRFGWNSFFFRFELRFVAQVLRVWAGKLLLYTRRSVCSATLITRGLKQCGYGFLKKEIDSGKLFRRLKKAAEDASYTWYRRFQGEGCCTVEIQKAAYFSLFYKRYSTKLWWRISNEDENIENVDFIKNR